MHKIYYISETNKLVVHNYEEAERLIDIIYSAAYYESNGKTYRGCSPRFDDYHQRSDPSKVNKMMMLNNQIYEIGEEDNLLYRVIDCYETWVNDNYAFGLSSVVQACYSQKGYITATSVQKIDGGWRIHVVVNRVNRYTGEKMIKDTVDLKQAVDNWYDYSYRKMNRQVTQ